MDTGDRGKQNGNGNGHRASRPEASAPRPTTGTAPHTGIVGFFQRAMERIATPRRPAPRRAHDEPPWERPLDAPVRGWSVRGGRAEEPGEWLRREREYERARYGEYGRGFASDDPRRYAGRGEGYGPIPEQGAAYGHGDLSRGEERGWGEAPDDAYDREWSRDDANTGPRTEGPGEHGAWQTGTSREPPGRAPRGYGWTRDERVWAGGRHEPEGFVGHDRSGFDRSGRGYEPPYDRGPRDARRGRR